MVPKNCEVCGSRYFVGPYREAKSRTCSDGCRVKYVGRKLTGRKISGHPAWNKGLHVNLNPGGGWKKGHRAWNKGVKGIHLSPASELKPGHTKTPRADIMEIRIRINHRNRQAKKRRWIKI